MNLLLRYRSMDYCLLHFFWNDSIGEKTGEAKKKRPLLILYKSEQKDQQQLHYDTRKKKEIIHLVGFRKSNLLVGTTHGVFW